MSDAHEIKSIRICTSDQGVRYTFDCFVAGRRMMANQLYSTPEAAIRACKRWISKNGVKP